jgi:hypothetical protein
MARDIDSALGGWDFKPDIVQARRIEAADGRPILQMRIDLGVMQFEVEGRPDGTRPGGQPTYYEFMKSRAVAAQLAGKSFKLNPEQCAAVDREFMQFYHRRVCWLALGEFDRAVADADHTLAFMDFVRDHSPSAEFTQAHEQYRAFVLFHRTQAAAAARAEADDPEGAVDVIASGIDRISTFQTEFDPDFDAEADPMILQLNRLKAEIRSQNELGETLAERLAQAIAAEDYETAARLRDAIRERRTAESGGA